MRILAIALIGVLTISATARAEPTPTVSRLMSEPVSAFTFGLYRLDVRLTALSASKQLNAIMVVDYKWDENRIQVSAIKLDSARSDAKEFCGKIIAILRADAGWYAAEKGFFGGVTQKYSFWADVFAPIGYERKTLPPETLAEIDKIFELKAHTLGPNSRIECVGPLLSNNIAYSEHPIAKK